MITGPFLRLKQNLLPGLPAHVTRMISFGAVGGTCLLLQLAILQLLIHEFRLATTAGVVIANAIAFFLSTQVNYRLSRTITWRDRGAEQVSTPAEVRQRLRFNAMAISALLINQIVFIALHPFIGPLPASALGTAVASTVTFVVSAYAVFPERVTTGTERLDATG